MNPASSTPASSPTWQCVLVCWGTKYPVALINHLIERIAAHSREVPRFVLICDEPKDGLLPFVQTRIFPPLYMQQPFKSVGCQAKLAMFEEGVLPTDLPAVYIDLDTVVMGDMGEAVGFMDDQDTVLMLQSAIIPFGPIGRAIWRATQGRKYARGNSSVVVFHPARCTYIARRFRELHQQHPDFGFRPMAADERFISWAAQPHMKRIPKSFAVKFPNEFMFHLPGWLYVKALFPWVRARRERLAAITLCGLDIKPEKLLALRDAEVIADNKDRKLVWSTRVMGTSKQKIIDFYRDILPLSS
jgi:hypothetical protein